ncbi:MAG: ester cyclase [Salinirussus sp.]
MSATADTTAQHRETAETVASLLWSGRFDEVDQYLTNDYVGHDPMVPGGTHDAAEMAEYFEPMRKAFSDIEYDIHDIVAEGDVVFHRGELTVTHSGEFMGMPATNERFSVEDHIEWRFEDGKIAETWAQYDVVAMMRGIGMDVPGSAPA